MVEARSVDVKNTTTITTTITTIIAVVTQQVNHRPIKCQSRLWSQSGTKINRSHHGDNPLLRPTGIQIATKSQQVMAPTNVKAVHLTYVLLHIESNFDRLGLLSPTHDQRSQQRSGQVTLQSVLINKSKFLKATHRTEIRKIMLRKAGAARVNRRLRRYYLIVRRLPNVFALACRSLGSIYYDTGSPQDGKTPFGWLHPCRLVTDSRRYLIVGAPATMPLHSSIYFFPKQPCLND